MVFGEHGGHLHVVELTDYRCHVFDVSGLTDELHILLLRGDGQSVVVGDSHVVSIPSNGQFGVILSGLADGERDGAGCKPSRGSDRRNPVDRNPGLFLAMAGLGQWRGLHIRIRVHREHRQWRGWRRHGDVLQSPAAR